MLQTVFAGAMAATAVYKITTIFPDRRHEGRAPGAGETTNAQSPGGPAGPASRRIVERHGTEFVYNSRIFPGVILAFIGGLVGPMLRLGGGVIYVPIMTMGFGAPAAIATFTMLFVNPFALLMRPESVRGTGLLPPTIGVVVSATLMRRILHTVKDKWLITGFWTLAIIAAVRLILISAGTGI